MQSYLYTSTVLFSLIMMAGTYLGQNFLKDGTIRHRIADKIKKKYRELKAQGLIEIGPGKGALTKLIKDISGHFIVIEKDKKLKEPLECIVEKEQIIWGDVLETSFSFPKATLIVGNLPYYITSPILRKFFEGNSQLEHQIIGGLFMVQEEVGEKIRYDAKKKSYLYWLLNYAYQVEYLKSIPAKAFSPAPKVKSCIISLVKKPILPQLSFEQLQAFLDAFSPYSRKTLGKIAKMLKKKGITYNLPEQFVSKRLEELHWEDVEFILQA